MVGTLGTKQENIYYHRRLIGIDRVLRNLVPLIYPSVYIYVYNGIL